jgi:hypothetical protein
MNIYHFYHIWADGYWEVPVKEHIESLIKYKILDSVSIKIGIVGTAENRDKVKEYISNYGIDFEVCAEVEKGYEQETLDKILELEDEDAYILYMHTKGSFNNKDFEHSWRRNMTLGLVGNWQKCVELLDKNIVVGFAYSNRKTFLDGSFTVTYNMYDRFFSEQFMGAEITKGNGTINGNFWWTHLKYLKMLGKPSRGEIFSDGSYFRGGAEEWLFNIESVVKDKEFSAYSMFEHIFKEPSGVEVCPYSSIEDIIEELPKGKIYQSHIIFINLYEKYKNKFVYITTIKREEGNETYSEKQWNAVFVYDKMMLLEDDSMYREFYG